MPLLIILAIPFVAILLFILVNFLIMLNPYAIIFIVLTIVGCVSIAEGQG
jgi:hypothetical protein